MASPQVRPRPFEQMRRGAEQIDPLSLLGCASAQRIEQVDAGDALGQGSAEQPGAPDERLPVGDDPRGVVDECLQSLRCRASS